MLSSSHPRPYIMHDRTISIPIQKTLSTSMKDSSPKGEYSLKQNIFDPSKSSPPNEFMNKLRMRMSIYNMGYGANIKDGSFDYE